MKKSDLMKIIKPLVKECIEEILNQQILSSLVKEVASGVAQGMSTMTERRVVQEYREPQPQPYRNNTRESNLRQARPNSNVSNFISKMKVHGDMFEDIFEGVTPAEPERTSTFSKESHSNLLPEGANDDRTSSLNNEGIDISFLFKN